jgi:hypothetical protein
MEFLTFSTVCLSFPPINFLDKLILTFLTDSKSALNFAFYDTHMKFFRNHLFSFTSISGLGGSILSKKVKIVVPCCSPPEPGQVEERDCTKLHLGDENSSAVIRKETCGFLAWRLRDGGLAC